MANEMSNTNWKPGKSFPQNTTVGRMFRIRFTDERGGGNCEAEGFNGYPMGIYCDAGVIPYERITEYLEL